MTLVVKVYSGLFVFFCPKARSVLLTSFLFFWLLLSGCTPDAERETVQLEGETMGTTYHITLVAEEPNSLPADTTGLQTAIDAELQTINQHMSTYIPDSEIMLLNRAEVGEWHYVSEPLREVLEISAGISRKSGGAFDITVAPLVNVWGFGPKRHTDQRPSDAAIVDAKTFVGFQHLELTGHQVRKLVDLQLDLSAVAKGYGVDWIANFLDARGIKHYMVEIGGELRLKGLNAKGLPWRIAIERPEAWQGSVHKAIALTDCGMATSGDYRNYFEQDGKRFSHTIDPLTGYPIEHNLASVTVVAATSAEADAWATAINVLGPEKGMAIAQKENLAVYMILKDGDHFTDRFSEAFASYNAEQK